jgi:hypothetical protein
MVSSREDTGYNIMDYEVGQFDRDYRFFCHGTYHPSVHVALNLGGHFSF